MGMIAGIASNKNKNEYTNSIIIRKKKASFQQGNDFF
jgi:hypothetical protein